MRMLAWRNLVYDKVRLSVTVTGIVFAVVLIIVQLGLFLGFTTATSSLIDYSGADLWITAPRVPYIEQGVPFSERKLATVLATPGVAAAGKYIVRFTQWKRPDGRQESVQIVGVELPPPARLNLALARLLAERTADEDRLQLTRGDRAEILQ